jgi:hypothetical protein
MIATTAAIGHGKIMPRQHPITTPKYQLRGFASHKYLAGSRSASMSAVAPMSQTTQRRETPLNRRSKSMPFKPPKNIKVIVFEPVSLSEHTRAVKTGFQAGDDTAA